jgi:FKBP-type peptidyl-prolyl cis-trans isomerase FklB
MGTSKRVFAPFVRLCDNNPMRKTFLYLLTISLAGTVLGGPVLARQSSTPSSQQPAAPAPSTAGPKKPSATKTTAPSTAKKTTTPPVVLQTPKDKNSYAIGMSIGASIGKQMKQDQVDVDPALVVRGLKDSLTGDKTLMTDEEAKATINTLSNEVKKRQQELFQAASEKNKKDGDDFLAANKTKPDVATTPSGLQYKVLQAGSGPKPSVTDTVVCNYRGTLIDGTEFDSSAKHGQPLTTPVGQIIKGFSEALQLMPVGSKWEFYIPPSLGYGERPPQGVGIPPNATLIFEVELLSIQPKPQPKLITPGDPQSQPPVPQPQSQPQTPAPTQPQAPPQPKP